MVKQEITIHLHNLVKYLEFEIGHRGFWYNGTYKPSHIYNKN